MKRLLNTLIIIISICSFSIAQNDTMYLYKQDSLVGKYAVVDLDSITFKAQAQVVEDTSNTVFNSDSISGILTDIQGNEYPIKKFGSQWWMTQNLRVVQYNNGVSIDSSLYCWYDNDSSTYGAEHGALYTWEVVASENLCPTGWHEPSISEWSVLFNHFGNKEVDSLTNAAVFNGTLSGSRDWRGNFNGMGGTSMWWSATDNAGSSFAYCIGIVSTFLNSNALIEKISGSSVRCVKD